MRLRVLVSFVCGLAMVVALAPSAAAIHPVWRRTLGTQLRAVAVAPDGSVYAVGSKRTSITAAALLVKFAPDGRRLWSRSWVPFPQASTGGVAVDVAPNGSIVWVGGLQAQCEGGGYFVQVNAPGGRLIRRYVTPGWRCSLAEAVTDVAAGDRTIVVSGYHHGCCGDIGQDGWVAGFDATAHKRWQTDVEPPSTPAAWFDRATGVAVGHRGRIYATGWAATRNIPDFGGHATGTMVVWKLAAGGGVIWATRVHGVPMPSMDAPVVVDVRGDRLMVGSAVRGSALRWAGSRAGTDGWLGRLTTGGALVWSRTFERSRPRAAQPAQIAIDGASRTWIVGTRRDPSDRGLELFVRRYSSGGSLLGVRTLDAGVRYLLGTGIAVAAGRVYASGSTSPDGFQPRHGKLYRLAG